MSEIIGVIAEDNSDVEVVTSILAKYVTRNSFAIKKFVGNGCGKLKKNCRSWTETLFKSGCDHVLILHDLDRNEVGKLRKALEEKVPPADFPKAIVVIPIEELEAWLLTDEIAIQKVFNLDKPLKRIANTETISSPKEHLKKLLWTTAKKRYLNTAHNKKISEQMSLASIRRCPSFRSMDVYIRDSIFGLAA